jgi:predicted acylesterase/phospholipase RssA
MYSLILEGGGIKGIAHVGAITLLSEIGIYNNILHVAGTSAGSQVAALIAARFTVSEIHDLVMNTPFAQFSDSSCGCFRDLYRLYSRYGYHKGTFMENYINSILKSKFKIDRITFKELFAKTGVHLKLTGTCVSDRALEWFDHEMSPLMEVAKAVRISCCIPLYFEPVKYNNKLYVDGGCLRNLPIDAFENTIPIVLDLIESVPKNKIHSLTSFTSAIVETVLDHVSVPLVHTSIRIEIPTSDISATDFNISESDKRFLFYSGYITAKKKQFPNK